MRSKFLRLRLSRSRIALLALLLLLVGANLGWSRHKTRGWNRNGIPAEYDYQKSRPTPPARAVSSTAILVRGVPPQAAATAASGASANSAAAPAPGTSAGAAPTPITPPNPAAAAKPNISSYQLSQAQISNGHCSISRVAVALQQDGGWRVSLQADQNPKLATGTPVPVRNILPTQTKMQTEHIKRNEFHVVVRGYAANTLKDSANSTTLGKPLMFRLDLPPFWVQNGIPRDMAWDGYSEDIKDYFDLMDRVEVDLSYR